MKKNTGLLVGAVTIVATAVVYLLLTKAFYKFPMCWLSLSVILLLEIITTGLFVTSNGNARRVGAAMAFLIETVVMIPVSVLFINLFVFSYTWFFTIFIVLTVAAAVTVIYILGHDAAAVSVDQAKDDARRSMMRCRSAVVSMKCSPEGKAYVKSLNALEEDLRFANDTVTCEMDDAIYNRIIALSACLGGADCDAEAEISGIRDLIRQREFVVKNRK